MTKQSASALYFILTFLAGAAVGSWALWIYLMGMPDSSQQQPPPAPVQSAAPAVESDTVKLHPPEGTLPATEPPAAESLSPADDAQGSAASAPPTPTPKGHWNTVDVPGKSHEECLALTHALNDAYKDCRFGTHTQEWVAE
jgi:hypothetical protein